MDPLNIFNLLAGIASIGGCIFSFQQAKKSQSAAKQAQEIKDQMISNKKTSDISELVSSHKKAQRSMEKFGPGTNAEKLRGFSPTNETSNVQEFFALLKQFRRFFGDSNPNNADFYCERLRLLLEKISQSRNEDDLITSGKEIYLLLVDISPELKSLMDETLERTK